MPKNRLTPHQEERFTLPNHLIGMTMRIIMDKIATMDHTTQLMVATLVPIINLLLFARQKL